LEAYCCVYIVGYLIPSVILQNAKECRGLLYWLSAL